MAHKNKKNKSLPKSAPEVVSLSGPTSPVLFQTSTPNEPVSASPTTQTQTGQNPVSPATVKSIPLNAAEKALVRKDEAKKRKAYLNTLETDAQMLVKGYQAAEAIYDEATTLHRNFKAVVEEMRPVFERVRHGFAHLHKGETIMGERTGKAWAERYLGVTYDWLRRCLNKPKAGRLLLTDGTKVLDPQPRKAKKSKTTDTANRTDNEYIKTCVRFVATTLKPLESDPQRFVRLAEAIAAEILRDMRDDDGDTAIPEPAVGQESDGEFAPEQPASNPWFSMTRDEQKEFASERLRKKLASKRAEAEEHSVLPACPEQCATN